MSIADAIERHRASGHPFEAAGVGSFVLDQGDGPAVVLVHGVPTSSYLYRKVVPLLAADGFRAISFDFPGLGLAERPVQFDYSWGGLAAFLGAALDALEVERCHLVVHDIGGPIGCEWAVRNPERVASLTVLNAMLEVADFRRPWFMNLFVPRGVGELWLRSMNRFALTTLFIREGIGDREAVSREEVGLHYDLLKRGGGDGDGGRAFLRIMRGFELTHEKQQLLVEGLAKRDYPAQILWGRDDAALNPARAGVERALGTQAQLIEGKHFIQEDQAPKVAETVAGLARSAEAG